MTCTLSFAICIAFAGDFVSSLFCHAVYNDSTNLCYYASPPPQLAPPRRKLYRWTPTTTNFAGSEVCSVGAVDALCKAADENIHLDDTINGLDDTPLGELGVSQGAPTACLSCCPSASIATTITTTTAVSTTAACPPRPP